VHLNEYSFGAFKTVMFDRGCRAGSASETGSEGALYKTTVIRIRIRISLNDFRWLNS